jgi:V/A-type H+/Na+-transporting ATPase subunit I
MAIAEMCRIRLYGLESEREALLSYLMRFGAIQVQEMDPGEQGSAESASAGFAGVPVPSMMLQDGRKDLLETERQLASAKGALEVLSRHAPEKKPLFAVRRRIAMQFLDATAANRAALLDEAGAIRQVESDLDALKAEEGRIRGRMDFLAPWSGIGLDLSLDGTRLTMMQAGTLPASFRLDGLSASLADAAPASAVARHSAGKDVQYCLAVWHRDEDAAVQGLLKEAGWNRLNFRDVPGKPEDVIASLGKRLEEIAPMKERLVESVRARAGSRGGIEELHDALLMERDRLNACGSLMATGKAFLLRGWVPCDLYDGLANRLTGKHICHIEREAAADEDEIPVLVRSNGFTEAIRPVMDMYGTPSPREIDPNFLTLPFFAVFFGLIMSDAGYGLILTCASGFALWRFKMEGPARRFAKLVLFCGIMTVFWGAMFGGFLGIPAFADHALWFNPSGEGGTERLMVWCLLFGVIHLFTGMGLKAANLIRRRQYLDAVCDVGFPYIMFTGFGMTVLPNVPGLDPVLTSPVSAVGLYVMALGTALVVATAGRKSRSLAGKLLGGLPRLYDIIGFLGDVLSYMRLLALSLAGGILGGLITGMATGFGSLAARLAGGTVLLLLGHGINFAMSLLGAFVHSCRLQYLEFFSKFLEGGGKPFRPFGPVTRYIVLKQEDEPS